MIKSCVVFTTDSHYLFPTLVAAHSARVHAPVASTDILILCFGATEAVEVEFTEICTSIGLRFLSVAPEAIEGATAMMARLFLDRILPAEYKEILYLDSDILVTGELAPLLDYKLPVGTFLAANDPTAFAVGGRDRLAHDLRTHLAGLGMGMDEAREYFNSGVLRLNRKGWDAIGMEAWRWCKQHSSPSRFPDQDAINIVGRKHRLHLSLRWNFPIFLRNAGVEAMVLPRVHHFMSSPKPWHGNFAPWGRRFSAAYTEPLRRFPTLSPHLDRLPAAKTLRYCLQQRAKQITESITWGMSHRKARILDYEQACTMA